MTLSELSRYFKLQTKQNRNWELLSALQDKAHTGALGAQVITGMPHAPGVRDKVGNLIVEIEDVEEEIKRLEVEMDQVEQEISSYIKTIPDIQTRLIFRLRFLRCMTWDEVATTIGGRNTVNGVKKTCYRYLDAEKEKRKAGAEE
ncbi:MAG: hypothetical protein HFF84_09875 [Oscillibacter sp.]|nr:hypothetical protein [Oscillibacter sp.]